MYKVRACERRCAYACRCKHARALAHIHAPAVVCDELRTTLRQVRRWDIVAAPRAADLPSASRRQRHQGCHTEQPLRAAQRRPRSAAARRPGHARTCTFALKCLCLCVCVWWRGLGLILTPRARAERESSAAPPRRAHAARGACPPRGCAGASAIGAQGSGTGSSSKRMRVRLGGFASLRGLAPRTHSVFWGNWRLGERGERDDGHTRMCGDQISRERAMGPHGTARAQAAGAAPRPPPSISRQLGRRPTPCPPGPSGADHRAPCARTGAAQRAGEGAPPAGPGRRRAIGASRGASAHLRI